jgi:stearoyl-CoA desaturase (delta-9 desaturase)
MENNILKNTFNQPNLWGGIVPMHIFGSLGLWMIATGNQIEYWWIYFIIGFVGITMLGVGACYHRLLSHKSFTVNRFVKIILLWLANISGQGSPIFWVSVHRGYHHRHTDKAGDMHSPKDGFWHSYILWMFKVTKEDVNPKYAIDLMKDPDCVFFHRHYNSIFWISHFVVALISFQIWIFLMLLPALAALHSFGVSTSLNHTKLFGYQSFKTDDNSVNSIWTWFISFGEAWHNNHHADPKNANFGKKWWELDPTYWLIRLIRNKN